MNSWNSTLTQRYLAALKHYLAHRNERSLQQAYDVGRKTVAHGLGVIDMARIHETVLLSLLPGSPTAEESLKLTKTAGAFLTESLSPFEMTHRGFRDANRTLRQLNDALEDRNCELAAANQKLKQEIGRRERVERELRESEEHYRELFTQAKLMQENLRQLSSKMLRVQEEERKRISRELHDEVGQALTAVNVNLAVLKSAVLGIPKDLQLKIADAQRMLEGCMKAVHDFSRELRPPILDDLGLAPALRSFTKNFAERTGVRMRFGATALVEQLEMEQKTALYRVAQECLTNIARHARATDASVDIRKLSGGIQMEIRDNGCAFQVDQQLMRAGKKRLGLLGIQERVRLAGGKLSIESEPAQGTRVRVWIPFGINGPNRKGKNLHWRNATGRDTL